MQRIDAKELLSRIEKCTLPLPYRNILSVLCAEGARRRSLGGYIDDILAHCTSTIYRQLYARWLSRFHEDMLGFG